MKRRRSAAAAAGTEEDISPSDQSGWRRTLISILSQTTIQIHRVATHHKTFTKQGSLSAMIAASASRTFSRRLLGHHGIQAVAGRAYTTYSQLPEEHKMVYEMCAKFADEELAPNAGEWDKKHEYPVNAIAQLVCINKK